MTRSAIVSYELRVFVGLIVLVVLIYAPALHASLGEPILGWHTNMGSLGQDYAEGIAVDGSGNIYVAGYTYSTWGTPIHPYAGGRDAFVAKLNPSGERLWHTFMGSFDRDEGLSVAVDGDGNVYVTGTSDASWGTPVHSHAGGEDGFAVKLNSDGERQWHTFMGHGGTDWGRAIAVDTSGAVYVAGTGSGACDTAPPVNPHAGGFDVFVTKLSTDGVCQWYTAVGGGGHDLNRSMAVDGSGNVYVVGRSEASWGSPVNPHAEGGEEDAFVAKLNNNGGPLWHTFMGSAGENDAALGVAVDGSGNVYVSGSGGEWGTPINPFVSGFGGQGFAAKLNSSGIRQWNTFLGSEGVEYGWGMAIDESRNIFTGDWPHSVQLSPDGIIQRNFAIPHGGGGAYQPIAVDTRGNVYFGGGMDIVWWIEPISPAIVPWSGGWDACVVKFETSVEIVIDIKPGSEPNCLNMNGHGVIPVAIHGSGGLDVYQIDIETLQFAGMGVARRGNRGPLCAYEYSNGDAYLDLVCHFEDDPATWTPGNGEACVAGNLLEAFDSTSIVGCDSICIVP